MQDSTLPKQSNSAIKRQARIDNAQMKQFGGKLDNFDDNRDRHFNQRMLKAYLRGSNQFPFGFKKNPDGSLTRRIDGSLIPLIHNVILSDKTADPAKLDALLAGGYNDPGKVFGGTSGNKSGIRKKLKEQKSAVIKEKKRKWIFSKKDAEQFTKDKNKL